MRLDADGLKTAPAGQAGRYVLQNEYNGKMLEKDFENIICKYPDLIEEGLTLKGTQVYIDGKYVDIIFEDRFEQKLIVELKRGTVVRKDIAQLLDYEGHFVSPDNPTTRVMLVGCRIPKNLKLSLDHHGFEWKEIPVLKLKEKLQSKGESQLLSIIEGIDSDFQKPSKPNRTNEISREGHKPSKGLPRLNVASTFNELSEIIRLRSKVYPTNYLDLLLLENKNETISKILASYGAYAEKVNNHDFKTIGRIKSHIRFRESNDGWVFDYSGDLNDPKVSLVGLKRKTMT